MSRSSWLRPAPERSAVARALPVAGITLAVVALALSRGWALGVDSPGYIDGKVFRTPVYPLLLELARALFGPDAGLTAVFLLQTLFGCGVAALFVRRLARRFALPTWLEILVLLAFLEPFYGYLRLGNRILTEPIAYGLLLLVVDRLLAWLESRSGRDGLLICVLTAVAILHRPQFLFLLPAEGLTLLAVTVPRREWRRLAAGLAALAATLATVSLADQGVRWLRHGRFTSVPFTGTQLSVAALYLARPEDAELFEAELRDHFVALQGAVAASGLSAPAAAPDRGARALLRGYERVYNPLLWHTVLPLLCERTSGSGCDSADDYLASEAILIELSPPLLARHAGDWAALVGVGLVRHPGLWYLIAAALVLTAGGRRLSAPVRRALTLVATLAAANLGLVALVEPVLKRYSFYTDLPTVALTAVALVDLARTRHEEGSR